MLAGVALKMCATGKYHAFKCVLVGKSQEKSLCIAHDWPDSCLYPASTHVEWADCPTAHIFKVVYPHIHLIDPVNRSQIDPKEYQTDPQRLRASPRLA